MKNWCFALIWIGTFIATVVGETDFFPGLRRPPAQWVSPRNDDGTYLLAQLNSIIEEHARRKFLQQLHNQYQQQRDTISLSDQESNDNRPSFTYDFPIKSLKELNDQIQFGVEPSDPRYYTDQISSTEKVSNKMPSKDDYEDVTEDKEDDTVVQSSSDGVPYYKLKSPMRVNPKPNIDDNNLNKMAIVGGSKIQAPFEHNKNYGYEGRHLVMGGGVEQKPMLAADMDGIWGMYVVALIAGSSAALTVGLIGLGIAWYTLSKKAKAAADVEYPAYGVTGPNKDLSPTGDRKLAQSAQMYHYQHQKQQIIAMENRSNGERNGSLSEVESDDENEEGDYTVYECPGLASTVEMEVKNPLFLDDPTPATPANFPQPKPKSSTSPKAEIKSENEKKK